jgi:DNA helicase-2/ATP-dependent DNA helicase PcrA
MHTNSSANKLTLSTIHSSKGLEYERVYLLDVLDGILPSISAEDAKSDEEIKLYEEERRLYYVAMTRAKAELYLFTCEQASSAFTAEVMHSLPREVVDDSDVLSFVKKNLCGKSYIHRTEGKGVVIAQCGERLLVEYKGGTAQLMTLSEMIAERDQTPVYETSTIKEKPKKGERTSPAPLIAYDLKMYTAKMLVGKRVKHTKFGSGTILSVEERSDSITKTATIRFEGMKTTKKLALPGSVEKGYLVIEE